MNWNEYEAVWKRQPLPVGAAADVTELKKTFEAKSRKLAVAIRVRDYGEAVAGVMVAVAYLFFWLRVDAAGWPMIFALALVLGVTSFFLRERLRARRLRVGVEATLLTKVEADVAELRHQCRLLETLWCWYLGPLVGAMAIHWWVIQRTIVAQSPAWSLQRDPVFQAAMIGFMLLVVGFVWWINRRALRRQLRPRLAELEKLRAELLRE